MLKEESGPRLNRETFISVDVEASGPTPGEFSLLSIGACVVGAASEQFYVELKPITRNHDPGGPAGGRVSISMRSNKTVSRRRRP